jgi:hypothetical protein
MRTRTAKGRRGVVLVASAVLAAAWAASAADLKSPQDVKNALRILAYVQADMASKLPTHAYDRLPHENQEFQEAAVPMRESVANEPAELRQRVDALLKDAQAAANNVAEVSKTHDEAKITAAVHAVADALQPLNELFPAPLRPVPGELGPGPGRGGGPPPGLR